MGFTMGTVAAGGLANTGDTLLPFIIGFVVLALAAAVVFGVFAYKRKKKDSEMPLGKHGRR